MSSTDLALGMVHIFPSKQSYDSHSSEVQDNELALLPLKEVILNLFFPVGSIYMSVSNDFNPNTAWGGTWVKVENRFLLGSSSEKINGTTGGSETVTLSVDQMPSHSHTTSTEGNHQHSGSGMNITGSASFLGSHVTFSGAFSGMGITAWRGDNIHITAEYGLNFNAASGWSGATSFSGAHSHTVNSSGSDQPHDNMPPYLVVTIWKRTV